MIGDKATDLESGKRAGAGTILVLTGYGKEERAKLAVPPDYIADDILQAVNWILKGNN